MVVPRDGRRQLTSFGAETRDRGAERLDESSVEPWVGQNEAGSLQSWTGEKPAEALTEGSHKIRVPAVSGNLYGTAGSCVTLQHASATAGTTLR